MKIIVDLLGSDKGAETIFNGVIETSKLLKDLSFIVIGPKKIIEKVNIDNDLKNRLEIIDTEEYILNTEEPTFAVRRKKDASIVLGMKLLDNGEADGLISFGSTGAVLVSGLLIAKRMENVERPALTITLPTNKGKMILLDIGANIECTVEILRQFAIMGNIYAKETLNKQIPKVALLNIGSENGKGTKILKETYSILEKEDMNFVGNIESRDIFNGEVDVVVCDGFHGNVLLKTIEGSVKFILTNIKKALMSSFLGKIGGMLIKSPMIKLKKTLDYKEYGACPMLGLKRVVFKGHGSSDEKAVVSGITSMVDYINKDVNKKIEAKIEKGD
ncbi:MAG: phosphate acyltransferase PlsX [Parvimonas sp.]|uniref:phosphate acyltransferase PlsX n=1 Tax=Parvimonas sp. TaxID=1944660 RepID=UPI001CB18E8B|nr:phosphate acyltransferase PlsX [Parvimonas sp.]MBF1294920.1 phosphate acyltransferase PlsX [Parvimonas sp.]